MARLKYGNKITTVDGIKFRSQGEAGRYQELKLLEKAGEIQGLERQKKFRLKANGDFVGTYTCDFIYYEKWPTGRLTNTPIPYGKIEPRWRHVIEDFKGKSLPLFELKWAIMKSMHTKDEDQLIFRISGRANTHKRGNPRKTSASKRPAKA